MKKKILMVSIIIVLLIIAVVLIILFKKPAEGVKIIAERSDMNMSGGFYYQGTVICDDGSVYKFSLTDNQDEYSESYENLDDLNKCILNNTIIYIGKVSNNDLEKIKEYSKNVDNENYNTINDPMMPVSSDAGTTNVLIWNYDLNEEVRLKTSGDLNGENTGENVDELIDLIEKYTK